MKSNRYKMYRLGVTYPKTVLFIALLLSLFSLWGVRRLQVETNLLALLPQQSETVVALKEQGKYFGGTSFVVAGIESDSAEKSRRFADAFAEAMAAQPYVLYTDYKRPVDYFKERQWFYLDAEDLQEMERRVDQSLRLEAQGASATYSDLMDFADEEDRPDLTFSDIRKKYEKRAGLQGKAEISGDEGKFIVVKVKPKDSGLNLSDNQAVMDRVRAVEAEVRKSTGLADVKVGYTGGYQSSLEEQAMVSRQIGIVSTIVTLLLFLILFLYFKRVSAVALIALPLFLGVLWTGGLVYLILGHLSIITAFGAAILAGLGSDYGIYLLTRYYHEKDLGHDFRKACDETFSNTGQATFASMLTTVGSFVALLFSSFGVFVEFGVVGALGLVINYLAMMLLMPAFLALFQPIEKRILGSRWDSLGLSGRFHFRFWDKIVPAFAPKRVGAGLLLTLLVCGVSALSLPKERVIYFEDGQMDTGSLPANQMYAKVSRVSDEDLSPTLLMVRGQEQEEKILRAIQNQIRNVPEEKRVYGKVLGISSFVPEGQAEKREILSRLEGKFAKLEKVNRKKKAEFLDSVSKTLKSNGVERKELPKEVLRVFESLADPEMYSIYLYPNFARVSSESMKRYAQGIQDLKKQLNLDFKAADGNFIANDTISIIEREAPKGFALLMLFFAGVLFFIVKPFSRAFSIFAHLMASLVILSGVMWLFGMKLNVMNIVMIPVILGTGIDCFVHFSHRFDECLNMPDTLQTEIPAMLISSLTSIVGFGGLVLTPSRGLQSVGWIAVIGLGIVTLMCAVVFPRTLLFFHRLRRPAPQEKLAEALSILASPIHKPDSEQ